MATTYGAAPTERHLPSAATEAATALTEMLGVHGWRHLDAVLLASLALEAPLLLVGAHGTAKSLVAERVAGALELDLRHYNASLLNYDDLVGIPVPDDAGGLRYLGTAGAVWGAEFVFLDEINRCRPDLQNKLFPLVHERRIAGEDLPSLRHRWAAINPPGDDPDSDDHYLGVEELDPALVDRFWFVVPVPGWDQLDRRDRLALVRSGAEPATINSVELTVLVGDVAGRLEAVDAAYGGQLADYVVTLIDLLRSAGVQLSPRRGRVLLRAVCAVHAARLALGVDDPALAASAELTLLYALPERATSRPPSLAAVVAAHRQAWEVNALDDGGLLRELLRLPDAVARIRVALDREADDALLARLVTQALAAEATQADRAGLAFVLTRALSDRMLTPAAWGPLAELARPLLSPGEVTTLVPPGRALDTARETAAHLAQLEPTDPAAALDRAFLNGCGPDVLAECDWRTSLERFQDRCADFGVVV